MTTIQVFLIWILANGKLRYILGGYTLLLTLSWQYDVQNANSVVPHVRKEASLQTPNQLPQLLPNIDHWRMPDTVKQILERNLVKLRWKNKDSVFDTKTFLQEAKDILAPFVASDVALQLKLAELVAPGEPGSASIDAMVFQNLPQDPFVPPTPTDHSSRSLNKPTFVAEAVLMAMGELAGTYVVGYKAETEYSNPWAHEGFPRPGVGGSALTSVDGMLNHHQDMSYQSVIPDLLGLVCIREGNDPSLHTTLVSIDNIVHHLPDDVVSVLRQERFKITASSEWVDVDRMDEGGVRPRAMIEGKSLHLPVNWKNMEGVDEESERALESLRQVFRVAKPGTVHLRAGEMVIFNNQKVVHGRTPYTNLKYDGKSDRVLIRSYFVQRLNAEEIESRII